VPPSGYASLRAWLEDFAWKGIRIMFFKRGGKERANETPAPPGPQAVSGEGPVEAKAREVKPLAPSELRRSVDPKRLGFKTTADLEPAAGLIGQERALRAIEFGANIKALDFNVFVLGPPASGKSTAVKTYLSKIAVQAPMPPDWAYVNNFEDANRPKALRLPPGRARRLARGMIEAVDELRATLPAVFEGEDYQARRRAIDEEFRSGQETALEALNQKAAKQNIAILRTPLGFGMAPMHDGKVVKPEVFNQLPEAMRREVETRIAALQKELEKTLSEAPKADKVRRGRIAQLNEEVSRVAVEVALDDLKAEFADLPDVTAYLAAAQGDLVRNAALFLVPTGDESEVVKQPADTFRDPRFRRYMVNVMVSNEGGAADGGAPVYEEINPSFGNLMGRVEHIAQMGTLVTDFLLIKPGALHRANGGHLLIDARKVLLSPFAWEGLKRTLKAGQIRIEQPSETLGLVSTQTLEPEPVPLDVKVILLGDRELYYLLSQYDPDFSRLFKVQADFDDTIKRSKENDAAYARLIASVVATHKLKPVDAAGVARLIEEGARMAEDREKLTIEVGRIADIVREADYWSSAAKRKVTGREDIARAIDEHIQRSDRLRTRTQEILERGIVLVDTEGQKVGQINGLSLLQLGDFAFARPSRITARVRMGSGRVTDIEREAKLGGPLHSKGVMILWGYLAGRFAQDIPLALAASLVFEQSYGAVEGDSASSAELYALLSALAEAPIRQDLAVTGSVNQWGEVQAIGGVNEKIEGFFDVCKARGLTGAQGVLIPAANAQHLMLREDVIEAVSADRFAIYAVSTIDEGIELLTGLKAGERRADGLFPPGTVNRLVEDKLKSFAERARKFSNVAGNDSGRAGT
jgi:lon-related putative ATP-dependent protease